MKRICKLSFAAALFMSLLLSSSLAFERDVHDDYMLQVFFGKGFRDNRLNESQSKAIEVLEAASYLALDQFGGKGAGELSFLVSYGVPAIPSSISEIDFNGNQHHRRYTHKGWNGPYNNIYKPYQDDRANWNIRKSILTETVKKVFDLKAQSSKTIDSLSALIYYIHVLGDHIAETNPDNMYKNLIGVGGRHDQYDIIHELIDYCDVLFTSPSTINRYTSLKAQLRILNGDFSKLVNSDGGINTIEEQREYSELAKKLMDLLIDHIPDLLREESYFNGVFPVS